VQGAVLALVVRQSNINLPRLSLPPLSLSPSRTLSLTSSEEIEHGTGLPEHVHAPHREMGLIWSELNGAGARSGRSRGRRESWTMRRAAHPSGCARCWCWLLGNKIPISLDSLSPSSVSLAPSLALSLTSSDEVEDRPGLPEDVHAPHRELGRIWSQLRGARARREQGQKGELDNTQGITSFWMCKVRCWR